jgi:hypothetical protein
MVHSVIRSRSYVNDINRTKTRAGRRGEVNLPKLFIPRQTQGLPELARDLHREGRDWTAHPSKVKAQTYWDRFKEITVPLGRVGISLI